ncbi:thioredoxin [Microtetraspora sp. NBRC 16547]|uniref:thioredoxin n=1 Tax=Microtetraspora sp. NBRC 16547 TaxID=3030993 RepID=UPI0024A2AC7F|nr:thioredoxin [Microtetraspora sp. NBRC 16547]GLX00398.1 thiol reductase thioredoxin [Microtetraspora sp. NBRC 16547]
MPPKVTESSVVHCPHCGRKNRLPRAASGIPRCGECREPLPWVTEAGDDDFTEVVEGAQIPVVVDFWAKWCGPCRMVTPVLRQVAEELAGRVKLVEVNVDEAPRLSERFGVHAIPTLAVLKQGRVVSRQRGAAPASELREWVRNALAG